MAVLHRFYCASSWSSIDYDKSTKLLFIIDLYNMPTFLKQFKTYIVNTVLIFGHLVEYLFKLKVRLAASQINKSDFFL